MAERKRRSLAEAFGEGTGRRSATKPETSEPVNPASSEPSIDMVEPRRGSGEVELVPGKGGEMVPANKPVNMTFTVTAKERYQWTLELKRRGRTAVSVLRETMEEMMGEEQGR